MSPKRQHDSSGTHLHVLETYFLKKTVKKVSKTSGRDTHLLIHFGDFFLTYSVRENLQKYLQNEEVNVLETFFKIFRMKKL